MKYADGAHEYTHLEHWYWWQRSLRFRNQRMGALHLVDPVQHCRNPEGLTGG